MRISAPGGVSDRPDPATQKSQNGERLTVYLEDAHGALSVTCPQERYHILC